MNFNESEIKSLIVQAKLFLNGRGIKNIKTSHMVDSLILVCEDWLKLYDLLAQSKEIIVECREAVSSAIHGDDNISDRNDDGNPH